MIKTDVPYHQPYISVITSENNRFFLKGTCSSFGILLLYTIQVIIFLHIHCVEAQENRLSELRTIRAVKVADNIQLDGLLDDAIWVTADWQGDFIQMKPSPGELARARTKVAVAFDETHLYVAFRCFNPPDQFVQSTITRRDGNMDQDNAVTIYLDTFNTKRDSYYFSTNSLGTQVDGRIGEDGRTNDKNWDCIWHVHVHEDSLGWTAEFSIPATEIRIPKAGGTIWGINFRRNYPEIFETSFWTERDSAWRISRSGSLVGLGEFKKRFSVMLYPYMVVLDTNTPLENRKTVYSKANTQAISGADIRFSVGSTANGNITYNPDFATVEADLEVINLTRYETYYPEKRLFFIEGAELFGTHFNIFHSRRIGDIDYGLKSNGRFGRYNYAVLSVREPSDGDTHSSLSSLFRLQRDILKASNVGMTVVDKSWGDDYNRLVSADGTISLPAGYRVSSQFVGSFVSGEDNKAAYYMQFDRQTQLYNYTINYTDLKPGFRDNVNPVGFIQDDDRRQIQASAGNEIWIRKYGIDKFNTYINGNIFWSYSGRLRNREGGAWVGMTFWDRWLLGFSKNYHAEYFEKRFDNHTSLWEAGFNQQSWNNAGLLHQWGRNFDADFHRVRFRLNLKPHQKLSVSNEFTYFTVSPDPDKRSANIHFFSGEYTFTPNLWLRLITQYSSRNDRMYAYGLFGWRFSPPFGTLYIAYTSDTYDIQDDVLNRYREEQNIFFTKLTIPVEF